MPIGEKNERIASKLKQNKCKKRNEIKSNLNIKFRKVVRPKYIHGKIQQKKIRCTAQTNNFMKNYMKTKYWKGFRFFSLQSKSKILSRKNYVIFSRKFLAQRVIIKK